MPVSVKPREPKRAVQGGGSQIPEGADSIAQTVLPRPILCVSAFPCDILLPTISTFHGR